MIILCLMTAMFMLLMGYIIWWSCSPELRNLVEKPKYDFFD